MKTNKLFVRLTNNDSGSYLVISKCGDPSQNYVVSDATMSHRRARSWSWSSASRLPAPHPPYDDYVQRSRPSAPLGMAEGCGKKPEGRRKGERRCCTLALTNCKFLLLRVWTTTVAARRGGRGRRRPNLFTSLFFLLFFNCTPILGVLSPRDPGCVMWMSVCWCVRCLLVCVCK